MLKRHAFFRGWESWSCFYTSEPGHRPWTPTLDPEAGPQTWTQNLDPQPWTPILGLNPGPRPWTPFLDPAPGSRTCIPVQHTDPGPRPWTPTLDPTMDCDPGLSDTFSLESSKKLGNYRSEHMSRKSTDHGKKRRRSIRAKQKDFIDSIKEEESIDSYSEARYLHFLMQM